jgi:Flp pilus assembly protein TadG
MKDASRRMKDAPSRLRRFARCERGTQLVELAIVLPVMLVLFGATAEFGRFFYTYQTLSKATRSAARYLTVEPLGGSDEKAANLVVYGNTAGTGDPLVEGLTVDDVDVVREGGSAAMPQLITVRVDGFTYQPVFDLGALVGNTSLSLNVAVSPSTTMRSFSTIPTS